jgi:hypothetical protein
LLENNSTASFSLRPASLAIAAASMGRFARCQSTVIIKGSVKIQC